MAETQRAPARKRRVKAKVKAVALPPHLPRAQLASELACDLIEREEILRRYNLDEEQYIYLCSQTEFQMMLDEYQAQWASPLNAKERTRLKALLMVEDSLLPTYALFQDVDIAPQARLDALKQLVTLADAAPKHSKDGDGAGGSGFSISINIGGGEKGVTIEGEATESD